MLRRAAALVLFLLAACGGGGDGGTPPPDGSPIPLLSFGCLRSTNGGANVALLKAYYVDPAMEDRCLCHFDLRGLSGTVPTTFLDVPLDNVAPGPGASTLELYFFQTDETVSTDEWGLGTLRDSFGGLPGGVTTLQVDITSLVQSWVNASIQIMGVSIRGGPGTARYELGPTAGLPAPSCRFGP